MDEQDRAKGDQQGRHGDDHDEIHHQERWVICGGREKQAKPAVTEKVAVTKAVTIKLRTAQKSLTGHGPPSPSTKANGCSGGEAIIRCTSRAARAPIVPDLDWPRRCNPEAGC
jgi:hypothetical protein